MKEWVPQVKLKRKESEFFYFLDKANIKRHIRDAKKDILSVLIPILVQENVTFIFNFIIYTVFLRTFESNQEFRFEFCKARNPGFLGGGDIFSF